MLSSGDDEVAAFRWVCDSEVGEAGCVTSVAGADVASLVRGFGGRAGDATTMALRDVDAGPGEDLVACARWDRGSSRWRSTAGRARAPKS
jgi:hypothetical protein